MTQGTNVVLRAIRRDIASDVTESKRRELEELARRCSSARARFIRDYWPPENAQAILRGREIVQLRRKAGWPATGLSAHQNKVCLESALGILRGSWLASLTVAAARVRGSPSWSNEDKAWALETLRDWARLVRILPSRGHVLPERRERRLRRLVLKCRTRMPRQRGSLWFDLDCNLYRPFARAQDRHYRGSWIAMTGLRKGTRINLPLRGAGLVEFTTRTGRPESRPNLRVTIGREIRIFVVQRVRVRRRDGSMAAGLDKGLNTLLVLSTGEPESSRQFGSDSGRVITEIAERSLRDSANRQRLKAYERSIRNNAPARARRVRRRNLGDRRFVRRAHREAAQLKQLVDASVNALFRREVSIALLYCEDLSFRSRGVSRILNRRLARWLKGYLHERLRFKAELNGVGLEVVNAAYTSQTCPRCWFTSDRNRRGAQFRCTACGYIGSADAVAATNVLRRGSDPAITRYTSLRDVRQILEDRWRSARIGRAWGSLEAVPAADLLRDDAVVRAANNVASIDAAPIRRRSVHVAATGSKRSPH